MIIHCYLVYVDGKPTFTTEENTPGKENDLFSVNVSENNGRHSPQTQTQTHGEWPKEIINAAEQFAAEHAQTLPEYVH